MSTINATNSANDLRNFFSIPGRPVTMAEYRDFWLSLTDREKEFFHQVELV